MWKGPELLQLNEDLKRHMVQTWKNFYQQIECGDFVAVRENIDENEEVFDNQEISGNFFRGQIIDEIKDKGKVKVFLVDFGDTIEVCPKDIRPLPEAFGEFPQFALPCCLKNVKPNEEGNGKYIMYLKILKLLSPFK